MKQYQPSVEIVNATQAEDILSKYVVKEQYKITENLEYLRYEKLILYLTFHF